MSSTGYIPHEDDQFGFLDILFCIVVLVCIVGGAIWLLTPDDNTTAALKSYRAAVKACGADNIDEHKYTNGTKDYDCKNYSKVK